jgi:membrane associated rhomboid family serine protease
MADIAAGEYWRFITPVFVHIGILHFFFNAMGLYYIGYQIEHILGSRWFLGLYITAGLIGNLASCVFSLSLSAGASGALFGLLGAGYRLEGLVSEAFDKTGVKLRPRRSIYSGMVITNIVLGLIIPVIDNAAHIGGLIAGWLIVEAMLRTRPNRLRPRNPKIAIGIYAGLLTFCSFAVAQSANPNTVVKRFFAAATKASDAKEAYYNYSEILRIKPLDPQARLFRGKLLLQNGELDEGLSDISKAVSSGSTAQDVNSVTEELRMTGHFREAELVDKIFEEAKANEI